MGSAEFDIARISFVRLGLFFSLDLFFFHFVRFHFHLNYFRRRIQFRQDIRAVLQLTVLPFFHEGI